MRFVLVAFVAVCRISGSAIDRLRYLSRTIQDCLGPDCPPTTSSDQAAKTQLVDCAVRFGRNEGRELEVFVDSLKLARRVSKEDLENVAWEAASCLYNDRVETASATGSDEIRGSMIQVPALVAERRSELTVDVKQEPQEVHVVAPVISEAVTTTQQPVPTSPEVRKRVIKLPIASSKRSADSSQEPEKRKSRTQPSKKAQVESLLERICQDGRSAFHVFPNGIRYVSNLHVEMSIHGEWEKLLANIVMYESLGAANMYDLFCDTYRDMRGERRLSSLTLDVASIEKIDKRLRIRVGRAYLARVLREMIEERSWSNLKGDLKQWSDHFESLARQEKYTEINYELEVMLMAKIPKHTLGALFYATLLVLEH